jgi:hypothetical protein
MNYSYFLSQATKHHQLVSDVFDALSILARHGIIADKLYIDPKQFEDFKVNFTDEHWFLHGFLNRVEILPKKENAQ